LRLNILRPILALLVVAAALAAVPSMGGYMITYVFLFLIYLALAESFDILNGFAGYMNLGHVVFFAVGGYTVAILQDKMPWIPIPLAFLSEALVAMVLALVISYPFFRLKGAYYAIATLGLGLLMYYIFMNPSFDEVTGGAKGIMLPILTSVSLLPAYFMSVAIALATIVINYMISKTRFGLSLLCIKENEDVAQIFGINTYRAKAVAMMLSASIAGIVGGVYVFGVGYINPTTVLGIEVLLTPPTMALLGGSGIYTGPLIGAVLLTVIQEVLWIRLAYFHLFAYGLIMVVIGLFMPGGIVRSRAVQHLIKRAR
jgi:branched-chain amino acid transport system permease protein